MTSISPAALVVTCWFRQALETGALLLAESKVCVYIATVCLQPWIRLLDLDTLHTQCLDTIGVIHKKVLA